MIHYILLFFLLLIILTMSANGFIFNKENNTSKIGFYICIFILFVLSAFKSSTIGNDTHEYIRLFEMGDEFILSDTRYELGYIYLNVLLNKISNSPQIIFIVYSFILYFALSFLVLKYSKMPWLSLMIFFSYNLFSFTMSAVRQGIAMAILFIGFYFVLEKKYVKFIISVIIAMFFHASAFIFIFCPLLSKIKLNKRTLIIFGIIALFSYFLLGDIMQIAFNYFDYYSHYQEGVYFEGDTRLASILQLIVTISFLIVGYRAYTSYNKKESNDKDSDILRLVIIIQLVATVLSVLCLKINIIDRMVLYYSSFVILLFPNAMVKYSLKKRVQLIVLFLGILFMYTIVILIFRPNWNSVFPYSFFWQYNY